MFTVFSKKKYLGSGGEFPSFADECNGHVVNGDNSIRGTDYVLSAENAERWCVCYEPKKGDKLVLNCVERESREIVECTGVKAYEAWKIRIERATPSPLGFNICTVSKSLVESIVDFEKKPTSEMKITVTVNEDGATASIDGVSYRSSLGFAAASYSVSTNQKNGESKADAACAAVRELLETL